jgi:hypothetical protein
MDEPDADVFVWTFPLFILAGNFEVGANGPRFHGGTYYVAPMADGERHLAIFTDADLAQDYIEHSNPALNLQAVGCNPGEMLRLLKLVPDRWSGFLIAPRPQGPPYRAAPFSNLIDAIEQHFGIKD